MGLLLTVSPRADCERERLGSIVLLCSTYVHGFPPCSMPELGWTFDHMCVRAFESFRCNILIVSRPTLTGLENTMSSRLSSSLVIHPIGNLVYLSFL